MKFIKKAVAGAALALSLSAAQATPINVGGVVWDPDHALDFEAQITFTQRLVPAGPTVELTGTGAVFSLNSFLPNIASFCPGCELTLQFGGFFALPSPTTPDSVFSNGWLKLYVDDTPDYVGGFDVANATNGPLWLSLVATYNRFVSDNPSNPGDLASGQLTVAWEVDSVNGGLAAGNFDTNSEPFPGTDPVFISDLFSRASSTFFLQPLVGNDSRQSNGTVTGNSIPEPGSLALAGLGLLGLAAMRRRRQQ